LFEAGISFEFRFFRNLWAEKVMQAALATIRIWPQSPAIIGCLLFREAL
jgi:hypothetical protein